MIRMILSALLFASVAIAQVPQVEPSVEPSVEPALVPDGDVSSVTTYTSFDGASFITDDFITISDDAILDPADGSFTVSFWAESDQTARNILGKLAAPTYNGWTFYHDTDGTILFRYQGATGTATSTTKITGAKHHLAGVIDRVANKIRIYVDGILEDEAAFEVGDFGTANDLLIGSFPGSSAFMTGNVWQLRIGRSVRTQSQIAADMESGSLVGWEELYYPMTWTGIQVIVDGAGSNDGQNGSTSGVDTNDATPIYDYNLSSGVPAQ